MSTICQFSRSCVGGSSHISDDVTAPLSSPEDITLQFDARFESANLAKVRTLKTC